VDLGDGFAVGDTRGTEMLESLTSVLRSSEENGVGTSGGAESKLVKGDDLTTSLHNASAGTIGDAKSAHGELRKVSSQARIISDGSNEHGNLVLLALNVTSKTGHGHGRAVDAGLEETLKHNLVELRVRAAGQEAVQLHEKAQIDVLALGRDTRCVLLTSLFLDVNTLQRTASC